MLLELFTTSKQKFALINIITVDAILLTVYVVIVLGKIEKLLEQDLYLKMSGIHAYERLAKLHDVPFDRLPSDLQELIDLRADMQRTLSNDLERIRTNYSDDVERVEAFHGTKDKPPRNGF